MATRYRNVTQQCHFFIFPFILCCSLWHHSVTAHLLYVALLWLLPDFVPVQLYCVVMVRLASYGLCWRLITVLVKDRGAFGTVFITACPWNTGSSHIVTHDAARTHAANTHTRHKDIYTVVFSHTHTWHTHMHPFYEPSLTAIAGNECPAAQAVN